MPKILIIAYCYLLIMPNALINVDVSKHIVKCIFVYNFMLIFMTIFHASMHWKIAKKVKCIPCSLT